MLVPVFMPRAAVIVVVVVAVVLVPILVLSVAIVVNRVPSVSLVPVLALVTSIVVLFGVMIMTATLRTLGIVPVSYTHLTLPTKRIV